MAGLDLKGLIGKLNPVCQRALEGAAGLCLSRTNYNVEVEHWLTKLLEQPGNDICLLLKHFDIDQGERTPPPCAPRSGWRRFGAGQPLRAMRRRARLTALASARDRRSSWR
jgi:hypothetical protein